MLAFNLLLMKTALRSCQWAPNLW